MVKDVNYRVLFDQNMIDFGRRKFHAKSNWIEPWEQLLVNSFKIILSWILWVKRCIPLLQIFSTRSKFNTIVTQRLSEVKKDQLVKFFSRIFKDADLYNIKEITNIAGIKALSLICDEQQDSNSSRNTFFVSRKLEA